MTTDIKDVAATKLAQLWATRELSATRRDLQALRRGAGKPLEESPDAWQVILDLPETGFTLTAASDMSGGATRTEKALHAALSLYAVHAQSKAAPVHDPKLSYGTALRALRASNGSSVANRISAILRTTDFDEAIYHLASLHRLMRNHDISVNYAALAADLHFLQMEEFRPRVLLRWSRDLNAFTPSSSN